MTQEQLAAASGVKRSVIANIESFRIKNISEQTAAELCAALNINKEWLLWGTGNMKTFQTISFDLFTDTDTSIIVTEMDTETDTNIEPYLEDETLPEETILSLDEQIRRARLLKP